MRQKAVEADQGAGGDLERQGRLRVGPGAAVERRHAADAVAGGEALAQGAAVAAGRDTQRPEPP